MCSYTPTAMPCRRAVSARFVHAEPNPSAPTIGRSWVRDRRVPDSRRAAWLTTSAAITRYVVNFPPATSINPSIGSTTACSRDSDQVDAFAGSYAQAELLLAAAHGRQEGGDVVAPHAGGGDDGTGGDVELLAGLHVPYPHAGDLAGIAVDADHPGAGDHRRAQARR